jgi:hypothetical protein
MLFPYNIQPVQLTWLRQLGYHLASILQEGLMCH